MIKFIFVKILFMSVGMSAAGLAVMGLSRVFKGLFSMRQRYYMWLAPLILALAPVSVSAPPSVMSPPARNTYISADTAVGTVPKTAYKPSDIADASAGADITANAEPDNSANTETVMSAETKKPFAMPDIMTLMAYAYFIGLAAAAAHTMVHALRFRLKFNRAARPTKLCGLDEGMRRVGLKRRVAVYMIDGGGTPFVYGMFRPKLVLPRGEIAPEALLHELTHIKRHDLAVMLLAHTVKIVHFFNPLAYIFNARLKRDMELSCDEAVSAMLSGGERIAYGKSILDCSLNNSSEGIVCLSENGRNVKERIEVIMKNAKRTRLAAAVSIALTSSLIIGQTAFAAALNGAAPVKSYAVNTTDEIWSVIYDKGGEWLYSGKSGRKDGNSAALVNTPVYKGFKADMNLTFIDGINAHLSDEPVNETDAKVRVDMVEFVKSVYDGRVWQGKFDVMMNGELIFDDAMGYLQNIPGDYNRESGRLYIKDGEDDFTIERIDFELEPESAINLAWEEEQAEGFDASSVRYLMGTQKTVYGGAEETAEVSGIIIRANPASGQLFADNIPYKTGTYISTVPGDKYTFKDNNTASGRVLIKDGACIMDECEGTISGIASGDFKLELTDNDVPVSVIIANPQNDENCKEWYENGSFSRGESDDPIDNGMEQSSKRLRLSDLPFTMTLNSDKTKVIVKLKDNAEPYWWCFSYASYVTDSGSNVWVKSNKDNCPREFELSLCRDFGTHNLQFRTYETEPYLRNIFYDIMFRIVDGEIQYNGCAAYIEENADASGSAAADWVERDSVYYRYDLTEVN